LGLGQPLNVAILGAGRAAEFLHAPALRRLHDIIRVCAVFDIDQRRVRALCSLFPEAVAAGTAAELLSSSQVQAVAVLTPPATHVELALAAVRAGKHVLVEKPAATRAEDVLELARASRAAGVCAAAGHNLRHHRLVQRAFRAVRDGRLGRIERIELRWNSPGARGPIWQMDRAQGGGVLFDLGIHHIDLARFLAGSEFVELSAVTDSSGSDDLRASASGLLANGSRFTAEWSKSAGAVHTVRIVGSVATVEFAMYRGASWRLSPRSFRMRERAKDLRHALADRQTGGDSADSYRLEWLDFVRAIREGTPPACPIEDAAKNVVFCERLAASVPSAGGGREPGPALSVVLGVHGRFGQVRRTVRYLASQDVRARMELVLIFAGEQDADVPAGEVDEFFSCVVDRVPRGSSVALANAIGARRASAPVVAFAEDHCFPQPGWAKALLDAHAVGYSAVGPEFTNANPGSVVSWCDFLLGYGPWMSPAESGEEPFLPGHNCSYKRSVLLNCGEQLESKLGAETVFHFELAASGHRLFLEPRAQAAHLNFARWRVWLPICYLGGRIFAGSRAAGWGPGRKLLYAAASPLIPAVRLWHTFRHLLKPNRPLRMLPRLLPALLTGLALDGLGQGVGYLAGPGRSPDRLSSFEYNRERYIREADRRALEEVDRAAT